MRDAAIAVIHLYRDRSEISSQDAAAALGCSLQYARRIIESLVRRGILTPTRNRRGRGVRYSVTDPHGAPQKFLRSKKKQQSDNQSNGLKRISEAAKSSCKSQFNTSRKRTEKRIWESEIITHYGNQELTPRRPWMRDYMRLARWEAHKALGGQRCTNQLVAAICYRVTTAYNLTIERSLAMLKAVVSTLKQVLTRGRKITVKAVTWAVRRYLISLGLVRVRSRRRRPDYHRPAGSRRANTGLRTVASLLASALVQSQPLHAEPEQVQQQPPSPSPQRNYVDMSDIVNRYYRAHVQPARAEQCDNPQRAAEIILRALVASPESNKPTVQERKMTTQQVMDWYHHLKTRHAPHT
ncbi:MAG: hypothetical protein KatS3mg038_3516 [Candidatus Kapaibacterium sp.]|nr:MAG: hypothetical protein KatS3mg038_3516 [Candidatus Kapabacteria bacterium]